MTNDNFLPAKTQQLTESTSIALARAIARHDLLTPLTPQPIATTYIQQGQGGTPILLLHGFDSSLLEFRRLFPPFDNWAVEFLRRPKVRETISKNAYFDPTFVSADALLCAALHLEMPGWHRALISFTKSGGYPPFGQNLSQIQQPTLILWGKDDRILGTQYAHKFEAVIPNSQLIWIDDCGHVPHLEKPQITAEYIRQFSRISSNGTSQWLMQIGELRINNHIENPAL